MKTIGIDIGTTSICIVVLDGKTGNVLHSRTLSNDSVTEGAYSFERMQSPKKISEKIFEALCEVSETYPDVCSIGMTGQMHGILYVDKNGDAVSNLYTWQDESGNQMFDEKDTYASKLTELTGYACATGYGMTTYFYHLHNGMVLENAEHFCTIMDYIGMKLTGSCVPKISASNAASLGIFDMENSCFDLEKAKQAGMDVSLFPEVVKGVCAIGTVKNADLPKGYQGIPVGVAIGDNQASILGTVSDIYDSILVNVGTGSQISVGTRKIDMTSSLEVRPLVDADYIYAGSCLCGGRAYALLEKFFRQCLEMVGESHETKLYDEMAKMLESTVGEETDMGLSVNPQFCGTRGNPKLRGSIQNISLDNFTPQAMIRGFLKGIATELFDLYEQLLPKLEHKPTKLIGSGNAVRMNPYLQQAFEELFGCELQIPVHMEEAAYGTALFSLVAAGIYPSLDEARKLIQYTSIHEKK